MNQVAWLSLPASAVAVIIFITMQNQSADRSALAVEEHRLQALEMKKDFADAWNGKNISEVVGIKAIEAQREYVASLIEEERLKRIEVEQELLEIKNEMKNGAKQ